MIRSIIIDDEQHCIKSLSKDVELHCPSIEIVDTCNSAKEGLLAIKKHLPDLVFLDVEMPWMNGFEMLEILGEINFSIIFTKTDKLKPEELEENLKNYETQLFRTWETMPGYFVSSSETGDGKEEILTFIASLNSGE